MTTLHLYDYQIGNRSTIYLSVSECSLTLYDPGGALKAPPPSDVLLSRI